MPLHDGLYLGAAQPLGATGSPGSLFMPSHHLTTHGVVVGMTGSGKTGLVVVLIEEALRAQIPVLVIDVKGDLANLALVPDFTAEALAPWATASARSESAEALQMRLERMTNERRAGLEAWGIDASTLRAYNAATQVRLITPGADAGELLHVLSSLERRSSRWDSDREGARAALSAAVSLILRILGRDADPARSREHVLLSVLAERRLAAGGTASIPELLPEIITPPIESIGALEVDDFISKKARRELAASLNALLASPSFASWRQGATLDVRAWMSPVASELGDKTPVTILSVAHLDDDERALVLGVVLEEILAWVRDLPGSEALRALIVFDEVYGFLPPHPANPPTKRPLVALMKQARAFGVGVVVATQNPMDLDYRALSNAGLWCLGRLQTDADRARVVDALAASGRGEAEEIATLLKRLAPRWFLMRNARDGGVTKFLQPRWAMSLLRGPMTRNELRRLRTGTET